MSNNKWSRGYQLAVHSIFTGIFIVFFSQLSSCIVPEIRYWLGFKWTIETKIARASSNQSQTEQLKLKGIPLACYVSIGEPAGGEEPTGLVMARASYYWAEISLAYAKAGKFDQAIQLIERIPADDIASETKVNVATK
jgi:hypothetical protein